MKLKPETKESYMTVDRLADMEARLNQLHTRLAWLESIPAIADFKKSMEAQTAALHAQGLARNRDEEVAEERRMRAAGRVPMITLPGEKSPGVEDPHANDAAEERVQEPGPETPMPAEQTIPPPPFQ